MKVCSTRILSLSYAPDTMNIKNLVANLVFFKLDDIEQFSHERQVNHDLSSKNT